MSVTQRNVVNHRQHFRKSGAIIAPLDRTAVDTRSKIRSTGLLIQCSMHIKILYNGHLLSLTLLLIHAYVW